MPDGGLVVSFGAYVAEGYWFKPRHLHFFFQLLAQEAHCVSQKDSMKIAVKGGVNPTRRINPRRVTD